MGVFSLRTLSADSRPPAFDGNIRPCALAPAAEVVNLLAVAGTSRCLVPTVRRPNRNRRWTGDCHGLSGLAGALPSCSSFLAGRGPTDRGLQHIRLLVD